MTGPPATLTSAPATTPWPNWFTSRTRPTMAPIAGAASAASAASAALDARRRIHRQSSDRRRRRQIRLAVMQCRPEASTRTALSITGTRSPGGSGRLPSRARRAGVELSALARTATPGAMRQRRAPSASEHENVRIGRDPLGEGICAVDASNTRIARAEGVGAVSRSCARGTPRGATLSSMVVDETEELDGTS